MARHSVVTKVETSSTSSRRGWIKMALAILVDFLATLIQGVAMAISALPFPDDPLLGLAVGHLVAAVIAIVAFLALGGRSWTKVSLHGLAYTFRLAWPLLLLGAVPAARYFFLAVTGDGFPADFLPKLLVTALLCLSIGILEEFTFRWTMLNGLLAGLGRWHWGVLAAVIVSSFFFGRAHIAAGDATDAVTMAQAILKIVQTGMFGIVLCATSMHSREIGSAALFHALNDFLMMSITVALQGGGASNSYTSTDNSAAVLAVYALMIAVSLWPTIQALRVIWNEHKTDLGAFME